MNNKLVLRALHREKKLIERRCAKLKKESEEYTNSGSAMVELYKQAQEVLKNPTCKEGLKKLENLSKEESRLAKIQKKDGVKLFNKEAAADRELYDINACIAHFEYLVNRG